MKALAEELYGGVPARAATCATVRRRPAPVASAASSSRPGGAGGHLHARRMAPSLTWGEADHAWALEVLAHLLGSGPGSRLHEALVETGLATSASACYDSETRRRRGPSASPPPAAPRTTPEQLEAKVNDACRRPAAGPAPSRAECARSIRQITAGAVLSLDGIGAAPRMLGGVLAIGLPLETVEFWPATSAR